MTSKNDIRYYHQQQELDMCLEKCSKSVILTNLSENTNVYCLQVTKSSSFGIILNLVQMNNFKHKYSKNIFECLDQCKH